MMPSDQMYWSFFWSFRGVCISVGLNMTVCTTLDLDYEHGPRWWNCGPPKLPLHFRYKIMRTTTMSSASVYCHWCTSFCRLDCGSGALNGTCGSSGNIFVPSNSRHVFFSVACLTTIVKHMQHDDMLLLICWSLPLSLASSLLPILSPASSDTSSDAAEN